MVGSGVRLTIGQATEGFEEQHNVAEEVEEGNHPFTFVFGVVEDADALAKGGAYFLIADLAQMQQPVPHIPQAVGCMGRGRRRPPTGGVGSVGSGSGSGRAFIP